MLLYAKTVTAPAFARRDIYSSVSICGQTTVGGIEIAQTASQSSRYGFMPAKPSSAAAQGVVALTRARRMTVGALLLVSFACNVAVLFVPFMDLRQGLSTNPYSLLRSVEMLWSTRLYVLAALVVGFSVVFPFAKIGVLAVVCRAPAIGPRHRRWLHAVERVGKWSMLDVFLVCIILTLTSGQFLVGTEPMIGIPLFVAAIMLSMIAGELLAAAVDQRTAPRRALSNARSGMKFGIVWVVLSGLALLGSLVAPFLRISDWLLADNNYSIVTLIPTLWSAEARMPAAITAVFLVLAPLVGWVVSAVCWRRLHRGKPAGDVHRLLLAVRRWSMLDVFGLALAIFLVEGEYLMRTEVRWGALFLVALLAMQWIFEGMLDRAFRRID